MVEHQLAQHPGQVHTVGAQDPVTGSVRLSLTRGAVTCTAPALVSTVRPCGNHCGPPGGGRAHRAQRRVMPPTQPMHRFQALLLGARSLPGNHSFVATPCAASTGYFIAFFTIFSASAASRSTPRTSESRSR